MSFYLQRHVGKCGVCVTSPLLLFFTLLFPLRVSTRKKSNSQHYILGKETLLLLLRPFPRIKHERRRGQGRRLFGSSLLFRSFSHFLPVLLSLMGVTAIHLSGSFSFGCLGNLVVCGRGSSLGLCQRVCAIARAVL